MRLLSLCVLLLALPATAQEADPADVVSPEAIVAATYASIQRAPGEPFDWDRYRTLFIPEATMLPNAEQTGGQNRTLSADGFVDWIQGYYDDNDLIGGPDDRGFSEEEVHRVIHRYGDIATVFSTYEKHFWGETEVLGRGINAFQLVFREGRWWVVSIAWDEENGAGPVPAEYRPSAE